MFVRKEKAGAVLAIKKIHGEGAVLNIAAGGAERKRGGDLYRVYQKGHRG